MQLLFWLIVIAIGAVFIQRIVSIYRVERAKVLADRAKKKTEGEAKEKTEQK